MVLALCRCRVASAVCFRVLAVKARPSLESHGLTIPNLLVRRQSVGPCFALFPGFPSARGGAPEKETKTSRLQILDPMGRD